MVVYSIIYHPAATSQHPNTPHSYAPKRRQHVEIEGRRLLLRLLPLLLALPLPPVVPPPQGPMLRLLRGLQLQCLLLLLLMLPPPAEAERAAVGPVVVVVVAIRQGGGGCEQEEEQEAAEGPSVAASCCCLWWCIGVKGGVEARAQSSIAAAAGKRAGEGEID